MDPNGANGRSQRNQEISRQFESIIASEGWALEPVVDPALLRLARLVAGTLLCLTVILAGSPVLALGLTVIVGVVVAVDRGTNRSEPSVEIDLTR